MSAAVTSDGLSGFPLEWAQDVVRVALLEDLGPEGVDVTTAGDHPRRPAPGRRDRGARPGVVAGVPVIDLVLRSGGRDRGSRPRRA